jgi:hypothetical protein
LVTGCTGEDEPAPRRDPPELTLSFSQHRIDEGSARANLRVVSGEVEDTRVTAIGIDSPGFGRHVEDHDSLLPAGQTIDMRLTLPTPRCESRPVPAYGIVEDDRGNAVRRRLEPAGQDFLESLWRRRCHELSVTTVATPRWDWDFDAVGTGRQSYLDAALVLTREPGTDTRLRVTGMQGSVLFRLEPTRSPALEPGADEVRIPVRLRWGRCDAHAIGESSQTFLWKLDVAVGDAEPVRITVTVEEDDKGPLLGYLKDACG